MIVMLRTRKAIPLAKTADRVMILVLALLIIVYLKKVSPGSFILIEAWFA